MRESRNVLVSVESVLTLFPVCSSGGSVDFPLDQLDVKKKLKPKIHNIVVRLQFTSGGAAVGAKGYEIVAGADSAGGVELSQL